MNNNIMLTIPDVNDVIQGELAVRGEWVTANVATSMTWPVKAQKVRYGDLDFWVMPVMKNYYPTIAVNKPANIDRHECERAIMRFLSALCWVESSGALVDGFSGGNLPRPMGRQKEFGFAICEQFELEYLPEPLERRARRALALMREGRGINHSALAFLWFYRILESAIGGKKRGEWIEAHLDKVRGIRAKEVVKKLRAEGIDIGTHIRESGRNAIAHAKGDSIIDPDDPEETRRLWSELPLMEALAELVIEEEFDIETAHTVFEKHLYELEGFKKILGPDLIDKLVCGEDVGAGVLVDVPTMSIEIAGKPPYPPLTNLRPIHLTQRDQDVLLGLSSENGCFGIRFVLDFKEERVNFDINNDLHAEDDGTAEGAEGIAEIGRFTRDYWMNGKLRIVSSDAGELISRKDAFVPVNCWLDHDAANELIERWKNLAKKRTANL